MIRVIIAGFRGRMGSTAVNMVLEQTDFELVGLLDPNATDKEAFGAPVFNDKKRHG